MFRRSKFLALTCILTISVILMLGVVLFLCLSGSTFDDRETLVFRSNSAKAVYDGGTLTDYGYSLLSGELKEGHRAKVDVTGLQDGVGKSENRLYVTIFDSIGADVSDDYNIIIEYGILEIKPRALSVRTESALKEYDGTPLQNSNWTLTTPEALMPGDHIEVTVTGEQTEIGAAFNTCTVQIFDENGKNVSYNYDITTDYGALTVGKITLTIQSYSYTTQFGDIAECNEYGFNDWALLPGHVLSDVVITGRQEMPGTSPNTIESFRVIDSATGEDVSEYYNIFKNEGNLTVEPYNYSGEGTLAYVTSQNGGLVYLKDQSFGAYMGDGWAYAPTYSETLRGYSADYLTGEALRTSYLGAELNTVSVSWQCEGFGLPYYMAADGSYEPYDQWRDTLYGSTEKSYTVECYTLKSGQKVSQRAMDNVAFEQEYRDHVYNTYTAIDNSSTVTYMQRVIRQNGFYGNDLDTIYRVAEFVRNSAIYDLNFDPALDYESDIAVAFLSNYKRGVCRHYATAATVLYRAMGIPARYTEGFAVDTLSGQTASVTKEMRHAWVEIYIDGMGWMMIDVTGPSGQREIIDFEIKINSDSFQYGSVMPEITYKGFEKFEAEGYTFIPEFCEIPMDYGKHTISIVDYVIIDSSGTDVSDYFRLTQKTGTMQIYREIIFVNNYASDGSTVYSYTYDGNAHGPTNISYTKSASLASMNRSVVCVATDAFVNVGEMPATFAVIIVDEYGNDVSDEYRIVKEYAKVRITPRAIEIEIGNEKKKYDGSALVAKSYKLVNGNLVKADKIADIAFEGSQTDIGYAESTLKSITITNEYGEDITGNYAISYIPGELRVTP